MPICGKVLRPVTDARAPLVFGIDPGLRACGWGLVEGGPAPRYVAAGVIKPNPRDAFPARLLFLHAAIARLIDTYRPQEVAIEDPFVGALAPAAVKAAVSGYGASDKRQVQAMVRLLLNLEAPPEPLDAADALAVAICHLGNRKARALVSAQTGKRANGQTRKPAAGRRSK